MRNNYRNIHTQEIAEYDSVMSLWYIKGKEKHPFAGWRLEQSKDWEEIHDFMEAYQVVEHIGVGTSDSIMVDIPLNDEIYTDKKIAEKRADELWKEKTTEEDRKSGWCSRHFHVKTLKIKTT